MRLWIFTLMVLGIMGCKTRAFLGEEIRKSDGLEPEKCYVSSSIEEEDLTEKFGSHLPDFNKNSFILEFIAPKYEEVEVSYSCADLKKNTNGEKIFRHQTSLSHVKFVKGNAKSSQFPYITDSLAIIYCLIEIPAQYETVFEKDLTDDSISFKKIKWISETKITKKYVKKKPDNLKENQFYFQGGYWTEPKEINRGSVCGGRYTVRQVQNQLNKFGYSVTVNNIMTEETKAALLDFQKKNGLEKGSLNLETLKKLEIKY